MDERAPVPLSALAGHVPPGRFGAPGASGAIGVRAALLDAPAASVQARLGRREAAVAAARAAWGLRLPDRPGIAEAPGLSAVWTGPDSWLFLGDFAGEAGLRRILGEVAAVADQSDGRVVLRLSGSRVRDALAKLVPVDLHPRAFGAGDAALTLAGHVEVFLWSRDGEAVEASCLRSYAPSLAEALLEAAAEHGAELVGAD